MALYSNLNKYCLRAVATKLSKLCSQNIQGKTITYEVDALDDFTSQLSQRKADKWSAQKITHKLASETSSLSVKETVPDNDIKYLSLERINSLFQDAIELGDNTMLLDLSTQCVRYRICPSLSNLIQVLAMYAQNGDKTGVIQIKELCKECQPEILEANSHFRHYLAEAIWVRGNITQSLKLFKEVYKENAYLRRRIRLIFKHLILDVVTNRSEAALFNIVQFSEELLKDYNDFFPLTCIWQACFLSEWFTDQCLALDLLERNDGLCKAVVNRIPYVVTISLRSHRTEVVYRLLEILLKYEMKLQYGGVLLSLLDYQIRQGDLRSCSEIIQWSVENEVRLPAIHHRKFVNLLLTPCAGDASDSKTKWDVEKKSKVEPNFKF